MVCRGEGSVEVAECWRGEEEERVRKTNLSEAKKIGIGRSVGDGCIMYSVIQRK